MTAKKHQEKLTKMPAVPTPGTRQMMGARFVALPVAAFITGGLFLAMQGMISADFEVREKRAISKFEINPKVIDLPPPDERVRPTLVEVEVPPAPPVLKTGTTDLPIVDPVEIVGDFKWDPPEPDILETKVQIERDPGPIVRIPPIMPPRFMAGRHSGYCEMRFDVNPLGQPFNINTALCTNKMLRNAAIKSVQKWKYNPKIVKGVPVTQTGFKTRITFALKDEFGSVLPMPNGY